MLKSTLLEFQSVFDRLAGRDVVLYGTGAYARELLENRARFPVNIVGVMDRTMTSGTFMGVPVIAADAAAFPCGDIVIAALETNCEEIYGRIAHLEVAGVRIHFPVRYVEYKKALDANRAAGTGWAGLFSSPVLDGIGLRAFTDKSGAFGEAHDYLRKYEPFLRPYRDTDFTLLELGVFNGSSLAVWQDYFTRAKLIGVDIDPAARQYAGPRREIVIGDLADPEFVRSLSGRAAHVIIDDASHRWTDQLLALFTLYPAMPAAGLYILEDIHTSFEPLASDYGFRGDTHTGGGGGRRPFPSCSAWPSSLPFSRKTSPTPPGASGRSRPRCARLNWTTRSPVSPV